MKRFLAVLLMCAHTLLFAFPGSPFNAKSQLESATLVCHVKIVSTKAHEIENDTHFQPALKTDGVLATATVIATINGTAGAEIQILHRSSTNTVYYTEFAAGEECLVFLTKGDDGFYRLVNDRNSKVVVPPHAALAYKSENAEGRLVEELLFAADKLKDPARFFVVEEAAIFPSESVVDFLSKLAQSADMAAQGIALKCLIRMDRPSKVDDLVKFLARRDAFNSLKLYQTTEFEPARLRGEILRAIETRLSVIDRDYDLRGRDPREVARKNAARASAERWKDFDLIGFLNAADWRHLDPDNSNYDSNVARMMGRHVDESGVPAKLHHTFRKGARAIAVSLVQGKDRETVFQAAEAIDRMVTEPHKWIWPLTAKVTDRNKAYDDYAQTCRDWIAEHPEWATE